MKKYLQYPIHKKSGVIFFDRKLHKTIFISNNELYQCLICKKYFRMLSGTHLLKHNTNEEEYKEKFNIPFTTGLECKNTFEKLSAISKRIPIEKKKKVLEIIRKYGKREFGEMNTQHHTDASWNSLREYKKRYSEKIKKEIGEMIISRHNLLKRKLRKKDFTDTEYSRIFNVFGKLSYAIKQLKLPEYPDIREWQRKPEEYKKERMLKYQRQWIINNPDKIKKYYENRLSKKLLAG